MTPAGPSSRQTILSLVILAILATIGGVILWQHAQAPPMTLLPTLAAQNDQGTEEADLLPGADNSAPTGFHSLGPVERYTSETLFEKIDGKAPLYLEAGFIELRSLRYSDSTSPERWFEALLYRMRGPQESFAVYSSQRRPDGVTLASQENHHLYRTANGLYLQHDGYYLEMIGSQADGRLLQAMEELAGRLFPAAPTTKASNTTKSPSAADLSLFPEAGRIPDSLKFILSDAFGASVLSRTATVRYQQGDQTALTAYLTVQDSPAEGSKALEGYYQFLLKNGGEAIASPAPDIRVVSLFGMIETLAQSGPYLVGVHEAEDQKAALELTRRLLTHLQQSEHPGHDQTEH